MGTPQEDRIGANRVETISVGDEIAPFPDETYMSRKAAVQAVNAVIDTVYDTHGKTLNSGVNVSMGDFYETVRGALRLALLEAHERTGDDPFGDGVIADTITDTVRQKTDLSAGRIRSKEALDNRLEAVIISIFGSLTEVVENPHFDMEQAAPTP